MAKEQALVKLAEYLPNERPGECEGSLFDRYRPSAILALCRLKPLDLWLKQDAFVSLILDALTDFHGDEADVLAQVDEQIIRSAVSFGQEASQEDLFAAFPTLELMGQHMGLGRVDQLVLTFLVNLNESRFWSMWSELAGPVSPFKYVPVLAEALRLNASDVKRALHQEGRLARCGLVDCRKSFRPFQGKIADHHRVMADIDLETLRVPSTWAATWGSWFRSSESCGNRHEFPHLEDHCRLACQVLEQALRTSAHGTHVLLYGPAGTGKTTLARELAQRTGARLYEVGTELHAGPVEDGEVRLERYQLGQYQGFGDTRCLMLFDELEDLLPVVKFRVDQGISRHKGTICTTLENARIPTLWTTNSIDGIDPAILRRFTLVIEVPVPPRSVRRKMIDEVLAQRQLSDAWAERTAGLDCLTPAMTDQLGILAKSVAANGPELEAALDGWLAERLKAMDQRPRSLARDPMPFRCDLVNAEEDLSRLLSGLRQFGEGRLCLFGPPGTGKTAFANHLAATLDRGAMVRRGSDLRSMWVGETERKIARMFAEATREGAVLILDEADSFLSTRSGRNHRWEMNEVTEFLVQLENFSGIFIATTNRFEDLDPAFMRRFDFKLKLDYMRLGQRVQFFLEMLGSSGEDHCSSALLENRLMQMDELTPGDFISAQRRLKFSGQDVTVDTFLSALVHEVQCKQVNAGRRIGFM